ncbi:MAG: class I SAM-dependent methyltransferase [Pirellulales bacterium]
MAVQTFADVPIDAVSDYWNRRPCNIRHSPLPVGTREYFDQVEERKYLVEPHIPGFAEFARWKGKKVLEIGCGLGTDTINFARAGALVTAVDLSEESLKLAKQRAQVMGVADRIKFYRANAEQLTSVVPHDTYDLVYSFGVIHHTPHPGAVLEQIRTFVGPQSTFKMMVYYRYSWKVLWIMLRHGGANFARTAEWVAKYSEAQTGCPVTYIYSKAEGRKFLADHGFETTETLVDHVFPYKIEEYKQYRYQKVWYFRWIPRPVFRAFERCFGWHLCLTARPVGEAPAAAARAA